MSQATRLLPGLSPLPQSWLQHETGAVTRLKASPQLLLFALSAALLACGVAAWAAGWPNLDEAAWVIATLVGLCVSLAATGRALWRRQPSVDVIALLALVGALLVGEPFAGAMITVMLASGALLEARAGARSRQELSLLLERAPRTARLRVQGSIRQVAVEDVALGDRLMVGSGEIVPVDGRLLSAAVLNESALTGEPLPIEREIGYDVRSGVVNAGQSFDLLTTASAAESTYAGVVRLVEQAQAASAPFVRTADRFALYFVPLTLLVAAGAWLVSGNAVRAVAVLVVATPCPLLLAAPIALMSGLSRAAGIGVVIKGGAALEQLAAGQVMLFDKTGTLTQGRPEVADVVPAPGTAADELLRLAASLDQVSPHVLASAIVSAATRRRLPLTVPVDVREVHGYGLEGVVGGQQVRIGKAAWILAGDTPAWPRRAQRRAEIDSTLAVFIAVDGRPAGAVLLEDPIRPDAPRMLRSLRTAGITRVVLLTGERADVADMVGRVVGVDEVLADCDPAQKLAVIRRESAAAQTIMVGDGINDAPALAAAGAGVALASRGATASSEAADVVLTVDRIDAIAGAILIARRCRSIALQAVLTGMGLSVVAMGLAAAGLLIPAVGAVLQEAIDVLAIAIALRAVLPGRERPHSMTEADIATAMCLRAEHDAVQPVVELVRTVADGLSDGGADLAPVRGLLHRLEGELLAHERADEQALVPLVARALGGPDSTAGLSRTHAEIEHQISRLHRLLAGTSDPDGGGGDVVELRRLLYGLYAILRLHNAQEDEGAVALVSAHAGPP